MRKISVAVLLGLVLANDSVPAQTSPPAAKSSGRYLFIVETSTSMRRRAATVQDAVRSLLRSGLNGQLQPGDTLGLWTFNEELYAGRFPLRTWTPESREEIAQTAVEFLKKQRYEKSARAASFFRELQQVINDSETITVLLVSAGESGMEGTPFDEQINAMYAKWRREMQRTQMPFITVLRARKGQMTGCTVNMLPWPVEFPAFQPPAVATKLAQPSSMPPSAPVPAPKARAPLILDMSKAKPAPATPQEAPSVDPAPAPSVSSPPAQVSPAPTPTTAATTASETLRPPSALASNLPPTEPIQPAAKTVTQASSEKVPEVSPVTASFSQPTTSVAAAKPSAPATVTATNAPPAASPVLAPTPTPHESKSATLTEPNRASPESPPAKPRPDQIPPAQTAVTVPPETSGSVKALLWVSVALLVVVIGLLVYLLRRARTAQSASLITRSMDRDAK